MKKAVILMSGGVDSTTVAAIAKSKNFELIALSFNYGQRHVVELEAVKKVVKFFDIKKHIIVNIDLKIFGGSALTDDIDVPDHAENTLIPITYVPARNTIFLSYALAFAEVNNAFDVFIGANIVDYSGYPDCRPEYIKAFENMSNLALKETVEGRGTITIHTPIINMSKAEVIKQGNILGVDYTMTYSCYNPTDDGKSCGQCDSCKIRLKGFKENNMTDGIPYV
jgi:7-cyano-7-deazaguanine synthase